MKSVVAASLMAGAFALDSNPICSGDNDQIKPQPGCFSAPYGSTTFWPDGKVSLELEEVNGDSGVITFKGEGGYGVVGLFWDCEHLAYTRKGTIFLDERDTGNDCYRILPLDTVEVEFCPNQDAFRFTAGEVISRSTFMPRVACPTTVVASGKSGPVEDFKKLDKHMHCQGPDPGPYKVYQMNLASMQQIPSILRAGQKAGLNQLDTVAIYGWSLAEYEYINPIAWGKDEASLWIYPAHQYKCSLSKAEVWPEIEVLNSALSKLPPAEPLGGTLWRGSGQSAKQLGNEIVGGYSSTSRVFDEAFNFVRNKGGSLWAVESHTSGKDITPFTYAGQPFVQSEDEVLFAAGSRLGVVQCSSSTFDAGKRQKIASANRQLARAGKTIDIICLKELPALSLKELWAVSEAIAV